MRTNSSMYMAALLVLGGCTSFTSTALKRFDDNSYAGQSNGQSGLLGQARPFKGIPITLQVPTHLDIYIDEIYFVKLTKHAATEIPGDTRLLKVRTEVINSDKVFTVDFKRPGSGILDLDMTFDQDEQYFKSIVSQLEDDTIKDTATLIATSIESIRGLSASSGLEEGIESALKAANIVQDTRVVAFQRFDLNSPTFEQEVECFVNTHLNDCNRCGTLPDYDRPLAPQLTIDAPQLTIDGPQAIPSPVESRHPRALQ